VLLAGPKVWIYRLRRKAESRVKFVKRVSEPDVDALIKDGQVRVNPAVDTAQIDDHTAPSRKDLPAIAEEGRAQIISWRPDRIEVEVETKQPGILVVHEAYYPGWFAEVDGKPMRILRANVLFRGVDVGEGRHIVVFRFQPFAFSNLRNAFLGLFGRAG
jgi:hypothetical protein